SIQSFLANNVLTLLAHQVFDELPLTVYSVNRTIVSDPGFITSRYTIIARLEFVMDGNIMGRTIADISRGCGFVTGGGKGRGLGVMAGIRLGEEDYLIDLWRTLHLRSILSTGRKLSELLYVAKNTSC
ncbi:hypothetical protein M8C21_001073, partial [Ambrosia artemisiifolia]